METGLKMNQSVLHYNLGRKIGSGGMGEVFLADDTRLGRQVALKFLPASFQYDPDRRARFLKEARAASSLSSPNIAAIYDIGEQDGSIFIVMEYVDGQPLSARLERGPIAIPEAIDIAMQVADALDEAHTKGIVHCDIKGENLMITDRGLVKVLDFGLARMPMANSDEIEQDRTIEVGAQTVMGVVVGTVSYMSPEQALGKDLDHRSDLFSLGVVIYEMLAGRLPFTGDSTTEIIDRIVHQPPQALARFNYSVPPQLDQIVRKCLEKNPNYRYQTSRELYIDLRNLRRDSDIDLVTHGLNEPATALLSPQTTGPTYPPKVDRSVAVMTFSNITREPADDWIGSGIAETVTADLKNISGLSIIGRERIFEVLKSLSSPQAVDHDEKFAIDTGRRLGAAWIVSGGYQRMSDMIRITARVVEVETGALVRTVKIDGKISEIFVLQDRIVYELTQGLNLKLGSAEIKKIERDETESVEAYEDFSRGMLNLRMGTRDSLDRALYMFQKATERDQNYASAWAGLGIAYNLKGNFLSVPEYSVKAIELAQKAIRLAPGLASAHMGLGSAYISTGHYDDAIVAINEAIRLDPNDSTAHAALARAYWLGKGLIPEGIAELERSVAINPENGYGYLQLSFLQIIVGDFPRAEAAARKAIALQENEISGTEGLQIVGAHARLGYAFYRQGRDDEAIEEYLREMDFLGRKDHVLRDRTVIELNQKLGAAYLRKGMRDDAERCFADAMKAFELRLAKGADDPATRYYIASLHALRGDTDQAIKSFEQSLGQSPAMNVLRAKTDPDFDGIRDDPRFRKLIA
jgi:serine/threonine protein kinase/tetratricopeptide (TPR) repeat protein